MQSKSLQAKVANLFAPKVYKALLAQVKSYSELVQEKGISYARSHIDYDFLNKQIGPVIKELYIYTARQQYRFIKPVLREEKANPLQWFFDAINAYFNNYLLSKVVLPISQTTVKFVQKTLDQAISEGWSVQETVNALEDTELARQRARTIVRTESVSAMNFATVTAGENEDYETVKEWVAIEDKRTRHSHRLVDGEKIDAGARFSNGLRFPGDKEGSAKEVINCRCTMAIRAKRDANGKIIFKQNAIQTNKV